MAFPTVVNSAAANSGANVTSWTFSFGFTATSGNLLILCINNDGATGVDSFTSPASWTLLRDATSGLETRMSIWKRTSDGTETGVTIGWAAAQGAAATIHEFSGHYNLTDVESPAQNTGSDSSPNPPSLNPAGWGTEDTAWIATCGWDANPGLSSYPTNYTVAQRSSEWNSAGDGAGIATAVRTNSALASEDPGTFTLGSSQEWVAGTIAIRPAAAPAVTGTVAVTLANVTSAASGTTSTSSGVNRIASVNLSMPLSASLSVG